MKNLHLLHYQTKKQYIKNTFPKLDNFSLKTQARLPFRGLIISSIICNYRVRDLLKENHGVDKKIGNL